MAEAVVSLALETFRDLLLEEGRLLSGVGNKVKALQTQLIEMQSLLKDADRKQHESESVRNWISQIRDLAYRAEDVIETYALEVSSKRGGGLKNLLRRFSCIMKEFHSLHQLGSEISQIKSDLAKVSESMKDNGINRIISEESSSANDNRQWKRQSFPNFQIQDCFVGRDDELKQIVSLLVDDDQHRILSIWGMGGLGKTTIARKAYNHVDTKRYFQCFAWVCITQQCQIRSVLEDVLKQLNPSKRDVISSLSKTELIEELCQIQKDKRCIVVLDDLWEIDHWDGLKHAFVVQGLKSKILVTTRKQKVAEIGFSIQLGLLSMESGWELLKKKAFPDSNITPGQNEAELDGGDQFATGGDEDTCKNLRSLILQNDNEDKVEFLDIGIDLQIFKLLRVLRFCGLKFERRKVPKGIGNLIHLRYLCFKDCELDEVPSSIRKLSYLQILNLETSWDVRVPNVFNKLLRLKRLILPIYSDDRVGDFALELDKGLDELETLLGFDSSVHRLESITRLKNLRSFQARIRDNESLLVVIDILTKEWNKLQHCLIVIDESCNLTSTEEGLMVLQKVLTCPNIHELRMLVKIGKQLGECRNHVSSSQIVTLTLFDCQIEDDPMEILGKLPVLRKLYLWLDSFVGKDMTCPAFSFPRLTELELKKLPNLREWRVEEGAMPLLSKIIIIKCPELTMLPDGLRFISTLQELIITKMPGLGKRVLASEEDGAEGEGEDFDKVRHVPSIIINN